jgi:mono/diheme cytochrome c family protein
LPQFTAAQAATGKSVFNASCAVCHGNTMTNGTFAPPLAGEYFKHKWAGMSVRAFYDHARTMPPAAPASLGDDTYASVVAYVLELNGFKAGDVALPAGGVALDGMTIQ